MENISLSIIKVKLNIWNFSKHVMDVSAGLKDINSNNLQICNNCFHLYQESLIIN